MSVEQSQELKPEKSFPWILVIAVVVVLILTAGGAYFYTQQPVEDNSTDVPGPLDEPTYEEDQMLNNFEVDTSGWKIYTNDEYGFEFKHPVNYTVDDLWDYASPGALKVINIAKTTEHEKSFHMNLMIVGDEYIQENVIGEGIMYAMQSSPLGALTAERSDYINSYISRDPCYRSAGGIPDDYVLRTVKVFQETQLNIIGCATFLENHMHPGRTVVEHILTNDDNILREILVSIKITEVMPREEPAPAPIHP